MNPPTEAMNCTISPIPLNVPQHTPPPRLSPIPLKAIFWNSGHWSTLKADSIAKLAAEEASDIIMITNPFVTEENIAQTLETLARLLIGYTMKVWEGVISPPQDQQVGGTITMFSEFIDKPQLDYLIPHGALTWFRGLWGDQPFSLLSVKRLSHLDLPEHYRSATRETSDKGTWTMIATTLWNYPTYLCGDFSLLPTQLDDLLQMKNLAAWRVPFTGSDLSWTHFFFFKSSKLVRLCE